MTTRPPPIDRLSWAVAVGSLCFVPLGIFALLVLPGDVALMQVLPVAGAIQVLLSWGVGLRLLVQAWRLPKGARSSRLFFGIGLCVAGLAGVAALGGLLVFVMALAAGGGAWGRPLRVAGQQTHPGLRVGSDWTRGAQPSAEGIDLPTRRALEALWLHDAQKEQASVPAFSRVAWLLAAVGAPADLLRGAHQAALEEVDHAERCFALAAGYGGRSHTVDEMPELLRGGMDLNGDALVLLAVESLNDGCLLEDFNADVAGACAEACEEPVTRQVLEQIAREERSHAELSWAILAWCGAAGGARVQQAVAAALEQQARLARPTAVSALLAPLVAAADAQMLRKHGRIPDAEWAVWWDFRLQATRERARALWPHAQAA